MTSWPNVSERRKVISGGGGDVGMGVAYCGGGSLVISSRFWRRFRREGIVICMFQMLL